MSKAEIIRDIINHLNGVIGGLEALAEGSTSVGDIVENKTLSNKSEDTEPKNISSPLTLEELRAILVEKSKSGKQAQVKALITSYGVERLTEIPASEYEEVMKKAGDI